MHVYQQLFLGQIAVTSFSRSGGRRFDGRLRDRTFIVPFPVAVQPPQQQFCPAVVSFHVDHAHQLYVPRDAYCRLYRTSTDHEHSHIVELSEQDVALLSQGATIRKQTEASAEPGEAPHTHEVSVSCFGAAGYGVPSPYPGTFSPGFGPRVVY